MHRCTTGSFQKIVDWLAAVPADSNSVHCVGFSLLDIGRAKRYGHYGLGLSFWRSGYADGETGKSKKDACVLNGGGWESTGGSALWQAGAASVMLSIGLGAEAGDPVDISLHFTDSRSAAEKLVLIRDANGTDAADGLQLTVTGNDGNAYRIVIHPTSVALPVPIL